MEYNAKNIFELEAKIKEEIAKINSEISKADKILDDIETIDKEHSSYFTNQELYELWLNEKCLLYDRKKSLIKRLNMLHNKIPKEK